MITYSISLYGAILIRFLVLLLLFLAISCFNDFLLQLPDLLVLGLDTFPEHLDSLIVRLKSLVNDTHHLLVHSNSYVYDYNSIRNIGIVDSLYIN